MKHAPQRFHAGPFRSVVGLMLLGAGTPVAGFELWTEAGEVDKSKWECEYCLYEAGLKGEIRFGLGYVDASHFAFGNYTGHDEEGNHPVLGTDLFYRDEAAHYWRLDAARLGLDSRHAEFEGGRQGRYRIDARYIETPRLYTGDAETPFRGLGGGDLRLPMGWVEAGTTDGLVELEDSLHGTDLRTDRRHLGVGAEVTPDPRWSYSAQFQRDRKEGLNRIGASVLFRSSLLPEPVEYTTDRVDLGLAYQGDGWNLQAAYLGSFYRNDRQSLRWDNPFIAPVGHANEGQMALPPDNQSHQFTLSGNYDLSDKTRAVAKLALGRMTQDEDFLPYTVNPSLTTGALPRDSLEGEVRTTNLDARLVSAIDERLTVRADLDYEERDNRTPTDRFDYVSTDSFLPGARENRLYDRRDGRLALQGRYRLRPDTRISAGAEHERKERPGQEVEETRETTLWAEVAADPHPTTEVAVGVARADRDASEYRALAGTVPAQNPLLVKFNMAAREQQRVEARLHVYPRENLDVGVEFDYRDNDYTDTALGLRSSRARSITVDGALVLTRDLSVHAFASREMHENKQAGSQNFSVPDWFATHEDTINTVGVGGSWELPFRRLAFSLDLVRSEATGDIDIRDEPGFPDLEDTVTSVEARGRYHVSPQVTTELAYFYERLESADWMVEGIDPETLPTVLTLGEGDVEYDNHVVAAFVHYRF